jgi:ribose/xylose/arabinose/galactoside ABC-type transport system permease subunit
VLLDRVLAHARRPAGLSSTSATSRTSSGRSPRRILAVGMTAVIVSGGIDLSVGSVLALSAT